MGGTGGTVTRRAALAGLAMALAAPHVARAAGVTLRVSHAFGPKHDVAFNVVTPWAEMVAEATEGRVTLQDMAAPAAPPPGTWEALRSGACDLAYALHGYSGEAAFPRARLGQLSFLGDSWGASPVFASIYLNDLRGAEEHPGVHLLSVFEHGPGHLFLKARDIAEPGQLRGLRIRNSGGYVARLLADLGCVPVAMPPQAAAAALRAGEIDGVAFPYEGAATFGLVPEVGSVIELPGGFYNASWFIGINAAAWETIEPRDRAAIDGIAGQLIAELAGKAFDNSDWLGREACLAAGVDVTRAGDAMEAEVRRLAEVHEAAWIATVGAEGFDGAGILAKMRRMTGVARL